MTFSVASLLGVVLGMRHALEPDHLAAVSTLATEERSPRAGLLLGALWGLGHTVSLFLVGGSLVLMGQQMPARLALAFEVLVAVMVVGLGARALWRAAREGGRGPQVLHEHGGVLHRHAMLGDHLHLKRWTLATRPLLVGLVHGLAGSGALTALVLTELPTHGARLLYIGLFGFGSVVGMAALTGMAGASLQRAAYGPRTAAWLLGVSGFVSVAVGLWWGAASGAQLLGS